MDAGFFYFISSIVHTYEFILYKYICSADVSISKINENSGRAVTVEDTSNIQMVNFTLYLYAYRLDGMENGKWLFFDTLKLDFFWRKNKTLRRPYTLGLRHSYLHKIGRRCNGSGNSDSETRRFPLAFLLTSGIFSNYAIVLNFHSSKRGPL